MWYALIANLAVVGLLLSVFAHGEPILLMLGPRIRAAAFGGVMGLGAIASILLSVELPDGVFFDLRATLIGVSGLLGGPIAGLVTGYTRGGASAAGERDRRDGRPGGYRRCDRPGAPGLPTAWRAPTLPPRDDALCRAGYAAGAAWLCRMPGALGIDQVLSQGALASLMLSIAATFAALQVLVFSHQRAEETMLFMAAADLAPDFAYVKNPRGRFLLANQAFASLSRHCAGAPAARQDRFRYCATGACGGPLCGRAAGAAERPADTGARGVAGG